MKNVLIPQNARLQLEIPSTEDVLRYSHMIKEQDREPLSDLVYFLTWHDLKPKLVGELVESWVYHGKKAYSEINLDCTPKRYESDIVKVKDLLKKAVEKDHGLFGAGPNHSHYIVSPIIAEYNRIELEPVDGTHLPLNIKRFGASKINLTLKSRLK